MLTIYYRISNNSYKKKRLLSATKENCLANFLDCFDDGQNHIHLVGDNITEPLLREHLLTLAEKRSQTVSLEFTSLNNAASFKHTYSLALDLPEASSVYFVEDDYFHLPGSCRALKEGLLRAPYVSLYDHPDKYVDYAAGGANPFVKNGGEITRLILTPSSHWKVTNSTTMTFASTVAVLKEDRALWFRYLTGAHPNDFQAFISLGKQGPNGEKGRELITPVPGLATHTESHCLAPLVNWDDTAFSPCP